ncbi:DNA repair protein RecN [Paludibacter sp.]
MLKSIFISNYALISKLNINFESGLTVITGETGAGKSIILGALSLILGQRADSKSIQNDKDKCIVEAVFDISAYKHINSFFEDNELDQDGNECIIRRELSANGKSRAFINDTPVSLNVLKDLSARLIDIHSQHENLLLSNASYQMDVVDAVGGNASIVSSYLDAFNEWKASVNNLETLRKESAKATAELDFIRFQYNQLVESNLQASELNDLEQEQETLSHVEEIKLGLSNVANLMDGENGSLHQIKESISYLSKISAYVNDGNNKLDRIQSAYIELKDLVRELNNLQDTLEFNPIRLEQVENRLSEIYTLMQKFKAESVEDLIEKRDTFASQLERIDSYDERIKDLENKVTESFESMKNKADRLTELRKNQTSVIESYLIEKLSLLGMPNVQFKVNVVKTDTYTDNGNNIVEFLFSANKNRNIQRVEEVASGGEISRLMLAIKSMIANKSDLPTIIFDEIDTGISGDIANRMGEIMLDMSSSMQVIVITHLPQIASKGVHHFKVYKDESGTQTETFIQKLSESERIIEIATMLSGKNITDAAMQNAKELLGAS